MLGTNHRQRVAIRFRAPVLLVVLAATAVPVEFRPLGQASVDFSIVASDVVENVLMYFAVGMVLGELGLWRAVSIAALMSAFAETSQLAMMHRSSSVIDFSTNTIGAFLGAAVSVHWGIRSPSVKLDIWKTLAAVAAASALVFQVYNVAGPGPNARGVESPGTLEARWLLNEPGGRVAYDSSGHELNGRFVNEPRRAAEAMGEGVTFDGKKDYIDFGRSTDLRLVGSMTISAWFNSSSFPVDDAVMVSKSHGDFGYQLDTTVDLGPRTVGFKLTDPCGKRMIRYGATPLNLHSWYHVAGVYDASKRTMDVYLNGKLDDGVLLGQVTGTQRSSRSPVYLGRRVDFDGFEFAGTLRDVRIYSFALTDAQIQEVMGGEMLSANGPPSGVERAAERKRGPDSACAIFSEPGDEKAPAAAAMIGVFVAVACVGLLRSGGALAGIFASLGAGLLLLPAVAPNLPAFNLWTIPIVSLAGGVSVAMSVQRQDKPDSLTP